jgi:hypothetical protein
VAHVARVAHAEWRAGAQSGNTVAAENYYQHVEHYFGLMSSDRAK